jgi:hypothetical protein
MEVSAREREAWADTVPQPREIDVDEQPGALIADALPVDHDTSLRDRIFQAQRTQRAGRVSGQVDTRPRLAPGGLPLHHLNRKVGTGERSSDRKTGKTRPDDKDSWFGHSADD